MHLQLSSLCLVVKMPSRESTLICICNHVQAWALNAVRSSAIKRFSHVRTLRSVFKHHDLHIWISNVVHCQHDADKNRTLWCASCELGTPTLCVSGAMSDRHQSTLVCTLASCKNVARSHQDINSDKRTFKYVRALDAVRSQQNTG